MNLEGTSNPHSELEMECKLNAATVFFSYCACRCKLTLAQPSPPQPTPACPAHPTPPKSLQIRSQFASPCYIHFAGRRESHIHFTSILRGRRESNMPKGLGSPRQQPRPLLQRKAKTHLIHPSRKPQVPAHRRQKRGLLQGKLRVTRKNFENQGARAIFNSNLPNERQTDLRAQGLEVEGHFGGHRRDPGELCSNQASHKKRSGRSREAEQTDEAASHTKLASLQAPAA